MNSLVLVTNKNMKKDEKKKKSIKLFLIAFHTLNDKHLLYFHNKHVLSITCIKNNTNNINIETTTNKNKKKKTLYRLSM